MKTWIDKLKQKHACADAVVWASQFPTCQSAWDVCERGDWMLWLCIEFKITANNQRAYVQTALAIADSVAHLCTKIPEATVAREATQAWLDNPSAKTRDRAAEAAGEAARAAWAAGAAGAAGAAEAAGAARAAWAAGAAGAAGEAAGEAAPAAWAAAWAVAGAAARVAWAAGEAQNKAIANIVRKYLTCPTI
jgi:hypothetical protein